jgi:hypothetical protein
MGGHAVLRFSWRIERLRVPGYFAVGQADDFAGQGQRAAAEQRIGFTAEG